MRSHCFCWKLRCGFSACCRCGMVALRNQNSQAAARSSCRGRCDD